MVLVGLFLSLTGLNDSLRSVTVIGWSTIIFGIVLYVCDQRGVTTKTADRWSLRDALSMGMAQVLALIPGTSRSGITISAARHLGYAREDGARLAMLMSIPVIVASGLLLGAEVAMKADSAMARDMAIVAAFSFLAALAALKLMFKLLKSVSFTPYVIYRLALGAVLLWIAYS